MEVHLKLLLNSNFNKITFDNLDNAQNFVYKLNEALKSAELLGNNPYKDLRKQWRILAGVNQAVATKRINNVSYTATAFTTIAIENPEDFEFDIMTHLIQNTNRLELRFTGVTEDMINEILRDSIEKNKYKIEFKEGILCLIPL